MYFQMYKIVTYIPESDLEAVKNAMFEAGAGHFGNYECCSWQTLGVGQFRPMTGSHPAIGTVGEITQVSEWKVEMIVPEISCTMWSPPISRRIRMRCLLMKCIRLSM